MKIKIRQEEPKDYKSVARLIENAFQKEILSDHKEQFLVERLRKSHDFIPELSLITEYKDSIVGHILLSKIKIINQDNSTDSLALAPVSVSPNFQNNGIGGQLISKAHEIARSFGYRSVILLGHEKYYPRFGYKLAGSFGIKLPFEAPDENCMAIELVTNGLKGTRGMVEYPKEFSGL